MAKTTEGMQRYRATGSTKAPTASPVDTSKVEEFNQKFDLSNLTHDDIVKIAEGMENDDLFYDYDFFGVRTLEPEYAAEMQNSYEWIDGENTGEELDGVSALDTKMSYQNDAEKNANRLEEAIKRAKRVYGLSRRKPFLVMSTGAQEGNDPDEIVMRNGTIVDISKYIKR